MWGSRNVYYPLSCGKIKPRLPKNSTLYHFSIFYPKNNRNVTGLLSVFFGLAGEQTLPRRVPDRIRFSSRHGLILPFLHLPYWRGAIYRLCPSYQPMPIFSVRFLLVFLAIRCNRDRPAIQSRLSVCCRLPSSLRQHRYTSGCVSCL